MARQRTPAPPLPNGFIASATRLPAVRPNTVATTAGWAGDAWAAYDTVAELHFIAGWVGNMMSRAVLRVMRLNGEEYELVEDGPAAEALHDYFGGPQGQSQMLRSTGIADTVSGEAYHVHLLPSERHGDEWHVLATGAVTQRNKEVTARIDGRQVKIGEGELVIRVWTPHPRHPDLADSPVRSNLPTLSEMRRLGEHASAQLDSRLSGAGILFVPSEIQFAAPPDADPNASQADLFMQVLSEAITAAIKDRGSASATTPIVVTVPGEYLEKVRHLTFWSELDAALVGMRESAVRRLALGMDIPPEVLMGVAGENHWNAWVSDEAAIKAHLEPRLSIAAHAITTAYLQPAIEEEVPDPGNYLVVADTSAIRLRPNRSNEALELYDRGELSGPALRRETGFLSDDAPTPDEFRRFLLRKLATSASSPEQSLAAMRELGVPLDAASPQQAINRPPGDDMRMDTRRKVRDTRAPDMDRAVAEKQQRDTALAAACDALVLRALERAGNKLANGRNGLTATAVAERYRAPAARGANIDKMMEGTWGFALDMLDGYHEQPAAVVSVLDGYVRGLLVTAAPHTREGLAAALHALDGASV